MRSCCVHERCLSFGCNPGLACCKRNAAQACVYADLQRHGAKLEHVGLMHHTPDARVSFLHRTAGGKLDPWIDNYKAVDFVTPPLDPVRAHKLFQGTAEPDNYRFPPERFATAAALAADTSSKKVGPALRACHALSGAACMLCAAWDQSLSLH